MNGLSVIVITRNRLEKLKRCLKSVKDKLPHSEIIVVDNGSTDGTLHFLKDDVQIKSFFLASNRGVAAARNIGIKNSLGKFIIFLDDDVWLERLPIDGILRYLQENKDVGIIGPKISYPDRSIQESARSFPTLTALFWRGSRLHKIFPKVRWYKRYIGNDPDSIHQVDWVIGACQIIKRDVFRRIGLLDMSYFFGYEDADFCRRAKAAGYSTVFWPDACVYHDYARASAKIFSAHFLRHIQSISRFFMKR